MSDIRTRPITPEYSAGFEAAGLGKSERRPGRTRYVQDPKTGELYEVASDWQSSARSLPVVGDSHYDGMRSPIDGTDISSRTKHRNYMKARGLTTADDFTNTWAKAADERAQPTIRDPSRRQEIGRAVYELEKRNAKR